MSPVGIEKLFSVFSFQNTSLQSFFLIAYVCQFILHAAVTVKYHSRHAEKDERNFLPRDVSAVSCLSSYISIVCLSVIPPPYFFSIFVFISHSLCTLMMSIYLFCLFFLLCTKSFYPRLDSAAICLNCNSFISLSPYCSCEPFASLIATQKQSWIQDSPNREELT